MSGSAKATRAKRATATPRAKANERAVEQAAVPATPSVDGTSAVVATPTAPTTATATPTAGARVPLSALRRLARRPAPPARLEHCEFCGVALAPEHRHLLDRAANTLACACTACALLFEREGAARGKYLTVPTRYLALRDFHLSDETWDDLMIPVNMAFIYVSSTAGRTVAYYPSPAGATESLLRLDQWQSLVAANPILAELTPDVEALLINRLGEARAYYLAPIDACYQLVGVIRTTWRGLSGGAEAWEAITGFFDGLRKRSLDVGEALPAGDATDASEMAGARTAKGATDA